MAASKIILKKKPGMYSQWSLPVFTVVLMIQVFTHYDYDKCKVNLCACIFVTQLYHYHLSENIKVLCMDSQKWSQHYAGGKTHFNTFLRCEDWRVSWGLKTLNELQASVVNVSSDFFVKDNVYFNETVLYVLSPL